MIPSYFVELEKMPLTINGKLDRRSLPKPEYVSGENYVVPSTEVEEQLVNIWSEVLKLDSDQISVTRSFFEMGGHSLNAIGLVNKIHKAFNVELSLQEIFNKPTIKSTAQNLDAQLWLKGDKKESKVAKTEITI